MQHRTIGLMMVFTVCLVAGCTAPWSGDMGCLSLASYPERIDCQARGHRTISADEELRRKAPASTPAGKNADAVDPICYTKAGEGEKPCAK